MLLVVWKILWVKPTTQSLFSFLTTPPMPPFPEFPRTDDFLQEGIPEQAEIPPVARAPAMNAPASGQAVNASAQKASQPAVPSSGPDANPLDLFPQVVSIPGFSQTLPSAG
ncbi:hypothetical protein T459_00266 [Capsicum annuum]|uniref:Uncharacterized protein n=1 Tax=Capsicum annuum TaxID=4072 RepID=A0A2G3ADT0_CAPAN|nr:hypothetical protein T459_00266 [Capsicum annuum]